MTKGSVKLNSGILIVLALCVGLCGCKSRDDTQKSESVMEESIMPQTSEQESKEQNGKTKADEQKGSNQTANAQPTEKQPAVQGVDTDAGEDLDVVKPDPADDNWYKSGKVYTDDKGRRLEVFFDDDGMIEFAVDGLSLYFTSTDRFQLENNWRIYTCDDGTTIIYYPGEPAHLEISDGDYAGIYEAGGDKVK